VSILPPDDASFTFNCTPRKEPLRSINVGSEVLTVSWHHNGQTIATGDRQNIILWDSNNGSILETSSSCHEWVQSLAWNPVNERLLAAGCHNKAGAYLLEWKPDKKEILLPADVSFSRGVSWSPDGQILATSGDNVIKLWTRDGTLIRTIDANDEVGKVAWRPDGQILAVASANVVKLWKQDGRLVTVLKGHTRKVTSVTWHGQTLVSASEDGTVKLWQLDEDFADNLLDTLLVHSCSWLKGYLEKNPLVSKDDRDLQDLCKSVHQPPQPLTSRTPEEDHLKLAKADGTAPEEIKGQNKGAPTH